MTDPLDVESLLEQISFDGFEHRLYIQHEQTILKPRLKELGYKDIWFVDGNADNLGPTNRLVRCTDKRGKRRCFSYS